MQPQGELWHLLGWKGGNLERSWGQNLSWWQHKILSVKLYWTETLAASPQLEGWQMHGCPPIHQTDTPWGFLLHWPPWCIETFLGAYPVTVMCKMLLWGKLIKKLQQWGPEQPPPWGQTIRNYWKTTVRGLLGNSYIETSVRLGLLGDSLEQARVQMREPDISCLCWPYY